MQLETLAFLFGSATSIAIMGNKIAEVKAKLLLKKQIREKIEKQVIKYYKEGFYHIAIVNIKNKTLKFHGDDVVFLRYSIKIKNNKMTIKIKHEVSKNFIEFKFFKDHNRLNFGISSKRTWGDPRYAHEIVKIKNILSNH